MIETIVIVVVAAPAAVLIFAATRPNNFRIARTTRIDAAPEKIFPLINDYRSWAMWSPYEKMDLAMTKTFSGSATGVGSVYEWDGNKNIGKGRMEIIDASPSSRIAIKLDFFKPFEAHNTAEFTLVPQGGATDVTWAMHGPRPFMMKVMGLFFSMDKMVGGQFEEGLANLKSVAERPAG